MPTGFAPSGFAATEVAALCFGGALRETVLSPVRYRQPNATAAIRAAAAANLAPHVSGDPDGGLTASCAESRGIATNGGGSGSGDDVRGANTIGAATIGAEVGAATGGAGTALAPTGGSCARELAG
jgi:hypothetical protein